MDTVAVLGIDIAKNVFQLHGVNFPWVGYIPSSLDGIALAG
jgi:hypothetical protein